ncbi:MAG TPA: hypothetical protein VGM54_21620 [Chthoniobacter sp.]|jgi:hypothetical protein
MPTPNPKEPPPSAKSFLIEIAIYAALVLIYFLLVLHFLGDSVKRLYDDDKRWYAVVALSLMVGQGFGLDWLTTRLMRVIRAKSE